MEVYEKSYKGLVLWLIGFLAAEILPAFLPISDGALLTRIVMNVMTLGLTILCWMMFRNERIYWINGVSFEQAKRATSEQRREFAMVYLKKFGRFALIYLAFSVLAQCIRLHIVFDILIACVGLVAVAISTIKIKLEA